MNCTIKKVMRILMIMAMISVLIPAIACAETSGTCGSNLTWEFSDDGKLTISGTGTMRNYISEKDVPWYSVRESIETVVINGVYNP